MENHNYTASLSEGKRRAEFIRSNSDWTEREADIFIKGFVEGSVWKLDTAYHQPGDIPAEGEMILCDTNDGMPLICGPNHTEFCNTVEHFGIKKWAYVKDIMPCGLICPKINAIEPKTNAVNPIYDKGQFVVMKGEDSFRELFHGSKDFLLTILPFADKVMEVYDVFEGKVEGKVCFVYGLREMNTDETLYAPEKAIFNNANAR